ncbi:MAG: O-antigen ligase domain-containing protein [Rhizobiales bacterium]|nr:O-antigen ligase domain-containing protein [Hyphomicrobiales bacterium]
MATLAAADGATLTGPRIATESLRAALLWLMAFSGGFVFIEPGPYEFVGLATMFIFAVAGLTLRPALAPLVLLLTLLNLGYALSLLEVPGNMPSVIWVLVSAFLSLTAIFYAAMVGTNTEARLRWLFRGYVAAAVVVSLLAIAGYFGYFGGRFVVYSRATGTFKDPNVFAAFLVLPGLLILQRMLAGRRSEFIGGSILFFILMGGLFLSFSRAAWGQFAFCAILLMAVTFVTSRSASERFRIVVVAILGVVAAAAFVALLLSVEQVAVLFQERASLTQSYDTGYTGRFGRYFLAISMMLDYPFGMGPLQFQFPEAPHNAYLNAFITGGWISGAAYLTLMLVTLVGGLKFVFVRTPWQPIYHVVYVAFVGVAAESIIIDSDHWRHYFMIVGVLWGLMAVSREYRANAANSAPA